MGFSSYDTLDAADLTFLRIVLEEVCRERAVAVNTPDGESIARSLLDWYLFGVKQPDQLKQMLMPLPGYLEE